MHILDLSFISKNKLYIIIVIAVILALSMICISFSKIEIFSFSNLLNLDKLLDCSSYYAKYEITQVSNKNKNVYTMSEIYRNDNENGESFRFEYKDFMGNDIVYIVVNERVKIENSMQIHSYILNSNNFKKTNLLSLATYINIINESVKNSINDSEIENDNNEMEKRNDFDCFEVLLSEDEGVQKYEIILNKDKFVKNQKMYSAQFVNKYLDIFSDGLQLSKIEILVKDDIPLDITVFGNEDVYINLKYIEFDLNCDISEDLFEF